MRQMREQAEMIDSNAGHPEVGVPHLGTLEFCLERFSTLTCLSWHSNGANAPRTFVITRVIGCFTNFKHASDGLYIFIFIILINQMHCVYNW